MPELAEKTKHAQQDFLSLNGVDYLEFYVGNAKQAAYYYRSAFGMTGVAYRGPETGARECASYVLEQDRIRFVFTSSLQPDHPVTEHARLHGDGVRDIALDRGRCRIGLPRDHKTRRARRHGTRDPGR